MLDFRRPPPQRRSIGLGVERRLLTLAAMSLVVLMLIGWSRGTALWSALLGMPNDAAATQAPAETDSAPAEEPGTFRTAGDPPQKPSDSAETPQLFPGVRADYLSRVRDNAVFEPGEADAWFHLFDILNRTSHEELVRHSLGYVDYIQLRNQPSAYRGQVVSLQGVVRQAELKKAEANIYGITQYYQLWLQPKGRWSERIVVYCLKLPDGFPQGTNLEAEVKLTGFSYKRWAYVSRGGVTTEPLVLAATVDWRAKEVAAATPPIDWVPQAVLVGIALGCIALALIWLRGRSRRQTEPPVGSQQPATWMAAADRPRAGGELHFPEIEDAP